jgi:hypothetical protein
MATLFMRNTATRSFQLINVTPPGVKPYDPHFVAASSDGSHVVFVSREQLASDAPNGEALDTSLTEGHCTNPFGNVYTWSSGEARLVTVLPDGTPVRGTLAGTQPAGCGSLSHVATFTHPISADGERALFYANGGFEVTGNNTVESRAPYLDGALYLREYVSADQSALNGSGECTEPAKACTVQVDMPQGVAGSGGGGQFRWASADDSKIFFLDEKKLTLGAGAEAGKPDLYEYDVEKPVGQRLTDLTSNATESADVLGVAGASEDGSYVYFVAHGVLATNENSRGHSALAGGANLYLLHGGATTFIATLNEEGGDQCDWNTICLTSRVSQNGRFIAFDSIDSLTGYDNHPVHAEACQHLTQSSGSPCMDAYRYAADNGVLTCATCNPNGAAPASEFAWSVIGQASHPEFPQGGWANVTNAVSGSGEVFFETMEKLVPADENETWDVYEYDGGEGPTAQLHLISSGKSEQPSFFVDATPDGSNVFFLTLQSLLHADTRTGYDIYDARVGGGFASQSEPVVPPACEALEACRSPLSEPPAEFSAASAALVGAGNLAAAPQQPAAPKAKPKSKPAKCKRGFVKKKGKCVNQKPRKKARKPAHANKRGK